MATVNKSLVLEAMVASDITLQCTAGKMFLCICLNDGDVVKDRKTHIIPTSGAVRDQDGAEVYATVPIDIATKLTNLITAVTDYVNQAAADNKL
jgi:hypothetical protein